MVPFRRTAVPGFFIGWPRRLECTHLLAETKEPRTRPMYPGDPLGNHGPTDSAGPRIRTHLLTRTVWVRPRHCRTKVAPVFSAPPGSKERAPFSNSPAKIRKRRCKARVGLPWARCCSLSARPLMIYSRCGLHTRTVTVCRDRYPKASDTSSPPCLLRSLPAGAVAGWGLHPLEKRRLVTAHVVSGRSTSALQPRKDHDLAGRR